MPGLVGFANYNFSKDEAMHILSNMQKMITHYHFYQQDELWSDDYLCTTRSHTNILQTEPQPYYHNGYYVWLDGEFYNQTELSKLIDPSVTTDPAILLELYQQTHQFSFLKKIDGIFSAVLYAPEEKKVYLISDKRGLRPLYWTIQQNSLIWTSELKALLNWPSFEPKINRHAVEEFLGMRYVIGDHTWFENVEMFPAATVLTWELSSQSFSKYRYWWWDEIQPLSQPINEQELAIEVGRRFTKAVERRSLAGEKVGLSLSGGLDSRAILAAMPDQGYPLRIITYGQKNCEDVKIAEQVAKVKGAELYNIEMNADNWLTSLTDKVWQTDGSCSLLHMHSVPSLKFIQQHNLYNISLNGVPGDANIGGSHIFTEDRLVYFFEKRLLPDKMMISSEHRQAVLERFRDYYYQLGASNYIVLIDNRVRSFAVKDSRLGIIDGIEVRFPFMDDHLEELLFAIPDEVKINNRFYEIVLLRTFPEFYRNIPRQGTGVPIGPDRLEKKIDDLFNRIANKIRREGKKRGFNLPEIRFGKKNDDLTNFTNHNAWMRQDPARSLIEEVLLNPDALYSEYVSQEQIKDNWVAQLQGENFAEKLSTTLTLELWLQQVINGKYRC